MQAPGAIRLVNVSIVIVGQNGQDYQPPLLTPEFLKSKKIVGKKWELAEQPIMTPVVSVLKYTNGIVFIMELNKIQVIDNKPESLSGEVQSIADGFLTNLPISRHIGVGVNFVGIQERSDASDALAENFVQSGSWIDSNLTSVAIRFAYTFDDVLLRIGFDKGRAILADGREVEGILVEANYHVDIPTTLSLEASTRAAKKAIERFPAHRLDFEDRSRGYLGIEGES